MRSNYKKKPEKQVEIAKERIQRLFELAEEAKTPELAKRYVFLARRISMKLKVKIPRELKRRYCKHCLAYLIPGRNLRVRMQTGKVVYTCLSCNKHMRFSTVGK